MRTVTCRVESEAKAVWVAVLLGPIKAVTYFLVHGVLAATLGSCWSAQLSWTAGVAAGASVRVLGTVAYLAVCCWTMNENLFALLLTNVYSMLVRQVAAGSVLCERWW